MNWKSFFKWAALGAGLVILALIVQYNLQKSRAKEVNEAATIQGAQVGVVPANFPYSQDMVNYCFQAAQAGWTPDDCEGFIEYADTYYPEYSSYLVDYWPWYYNNYYWPYYGSSWYGYWPGYGGYGYWKGRNRRHGGRRRRSHRGGRRSSHRRRGRFGGGRSRGSRGGRRSMSRGSRGGGRRGGGGGRRGGGGGRRGGGRR